MYQNINSLRFQYSMSKTYNCKIIEMFFHCYCKNNALPKVGWKIHISAQETNFQKILDITLKYCFSKNITFKFIHKKADFFFSISKDAPRTFSGKFITIYPVNTVEAKIIMNELYLKLKKFKGPSVLTDRSFKNSIIHYRYGNLWHRINEVKEILKIGQYKPKDMPDPFQNALITDKKTFKVGKYKILSVIDFSNFGGVYLLKDKSILRVAKEARSNIGTRHQNPKLLKKREVLVAQKLCGAKWFPKWIESFVENDHFFAIYDFIPGITLKQWGLHLSFLFGFTLKPTIKERIEKFYIALINKLVELLIWTKQNKLVLNDVKADNFIWDSTENIKFVDLDYSFFETSKPIFLFNNFQKFEKITNWITDVKKTGFMLMDMIARTNLLQNKHTNPSFIIRYFKYFCVSRNIVSEVTDAIIFLSTFDNKTSLNNIWNFKTKYPLKEKKIFYINDGLLEKLDLFSLLENADNKPKDDKNLWWQTWDHIKHKQKELASEKLHTLLSTKVVISNNESAVLFENSLSTYLYFGSGLLICLLLFYKVTFKSTSFDQYTNHLLTTIKNNAYVAIGFWRGILGIVVLLLQTYKIFQDKNYLHLSFSHLKKLRFYFVKKKNNFFDINGAFLPFWERDLIFYLFDLFNISL